jgi:hypothetical protein
MNKFLLGGCIAALVAFAGVANAADSQNTSDKCDAPIAESTSAVTAPAVTISQFEFMKKKPWLCTCVLLSDADKSTAGKWQGNVSARTRTGAEKVGANNACEAATAQHGVDCKKCSCGTAGAKPFGTKIASVEAAKAKASAEAKAAKAAAVAQATAEAKAATAKAEAEKAKADAAKAQSDAEKAKLEAEAKAKAEAAAKAEAEAKAKAEEAAKAAAAAKVKAAEFAAEAK